MKYLSGLLLAGVALLLGGCVISSVYPFYTDKDVAFDATLVGEWAENAEAKDIWKFTRQGTNKYLVQIVEPDKNTDLEGCLFKLDGQLYLDLLGKEQSMTSVPVHLVMRLELAEPALRMASQSVKWLDDWLRQNPAALKHHRVRTGDGPEDYRVVLTAETADLQKFLVKQKDNPEAWEKTNVLQRRAMPAK